jgi:hypothetical protein
LLTWLVAVFVEGNVILHCTINGLHQVIWVYDVKGALQSALDYISTGGLVDDVSTIITVAPIADCV